MAAGGHWGSPSPGHWESPWGQGQDQAEAVLGCRSGVGLAGQGRAAGSWSLAAATLEQGPMALVAEMGSWALSRVGEPWERGRDSKG